MKRIILLALLQVPHGFVRPLQRQQSKGWVNSKKALFVTPVLGTFLFPQLAIAQLGPIDWDRINWSPVGANPPTRTYDSNSQGLDVLACSNPRRTVTFEVVNQNGFNGVSYPDSAIPASLQPNGLAGAGKTLFLELNAVNNDRSVTIRVRFSDPIVLGSLKLHDVDVEGANPRRWVDEVVVSGLDASNSTVNPVLSAQDPSIVNIAGNVATGNNPALNTTNVGDVTANFGTNLIREMTVTYRNNRAAAGADVAAGAIQAISLGDINFANPCITVAKEAGTPTLVEPGVYEIPYTIRVRNPSNVPLQNVQLIENFAGQLNLALGNDPLKPGEYRVVRENNRPANGTITNPGTPPISPIDAPESQLNINSSFNGSTEQNLLEATSVLRAGAEGTVTLKVRVRPENISTPLNNKVTANGTFTPPTLPNNPPPIPIGATNTSVNGPSPPPPNTPNPQGTDTPVTLQPVSRIGVAKSLGTVTDAGSGRYNVQYNILVKNYGSTVLSNVQVTENFEAADPLGLGLKYVPSNPGPGQYTILAVPDNPKATGTLTANTQFNGSSNVNLLNGNSTNTLAVGQSETITISVQVNPASLPVILNNIATATGRDPRGNTVTDESVNGVPGDPRPNPDPNNNNVPDEKSPTPVNLPPRPVLPPKIGVAKAVGLPKDLGGGVYEIPYTIRVQNYGGVALSNVQVVENLKSDPSWSSLSYTPNATPAAGQYTILRSPTPSITATGTLAANTGFDGNGNSGDVNLLAPLATQPTNTLAVGQSETIRFVVRVNPASSPITLNNQVSASGTTSNGTSVTDDSADDANNTSNPNPDTNNDGDPNNDTKPTSVILPPAPTPRIGVGKSATSIVDVTPGNTADGLFDIAYAINVQNAGNVALSNVQVNEPFASQFKLTYTPGAPGIGEYTITAKPSTPGVSPLAVNDSFTGSGGNVGILNPLRSNLAVGQSQIVNVGVRVNIDPALLSFILDNQVTATGTGAGQTVQDKSNDGTNGANPGSPNPDPDGDGDPGNNNAPTRISLPPGQPIPRIGTAKDAPETTPPIVVLGDGRFNIPYTIVVENSGTDALNNVQVTENFEAANPLGFGLTYTSGTPARGQYTLIGTPSTSSPLSVNPAFTGSPSGSINLLDAANSSLPLGQRQEIRFVVQVFPTSIPVTLNNQAQASGTGARSGRGVTDDSVDGLDSSPDGDLNPNNDTSPTPVSLPPRGLSTGGNFLLVKRITNVTRNGQGIPGLDFSTFTDDPNDSGDNTLNSTSLKPLGLLEVPGLQSGDEVEYTVYYLGSGSQPVTNARVCDLVPERTTFIPNSFGGDKGILLRQGTTDTAQTNSADGDNGQFLAPLAPVDRVIPPCPTGTTNPNGAVFSKLGDIPNAGPNQTGFLRFRVRID